MTTPTPAAPVTHRLSSTLLGLVLPLLVLVAATVLTLSWRDEMPAQIATHFGPGGHADGFGAVVPFVALMAGVFALLVIGSWALAFFRGQDGSTRRIAVGTSLGMAWFGATILVGTGLMHRGLTDAADVGDVDPVITVAVVGALVLGAGVALLLPRDPHRPADPGTAVDGPTILLGDQEHAAWIGRVGSPVGVVAGVASVVLVGILTIALDMPVFAVLAVVLGVLLGATTLYTVTVDHRGLRVRSVAGFPRVTIPLDEVVAVRTRDVHPLRDFGGWGYRVRFDGTVGVVARSGPAIEVERAGGRRFLVTVADAATGAALLTTLAGRGRDGDGPVAAGAGSGSGSDGTAG
jgi:hypothetical protein